MCENNSSVLAQVYLYFENQRERTQCFFSRVFLSSDNQLADVYSELDGVDDNLTIEDNTDNKDDDIEACSTDKQLFEEATPSSHLTKLNVADAPLQEFDQYWADYGDRLVLDSWIRKYGKYMNPEFLRNSWDIYEPIINKWGINGTQLNFVGWLEKYEKYLNVGSLELISTKLNMKAELPDNSIRQEASDDNEKLVDDGKVAEEETPVPEDEVQKTDGSIASDAYDSYWQELWQEHSSELYQSTYEKFTSEIEKKDVCNKATEESAHRSFSSVRGACHALGLVFNPDFISNPCSRIKRGHAFYNNSQIQNQNLGLKIRFRKKNIPISSEDSYILNNGIEVNNNEYSKNGETATNEIPPKIVLEKQLVEVKIVEESQKPNLKNLDEDRETNEDGNTFFDAINDELEVMKDIVVKSDGIINSLADHDLNLQDDIMSDLTSTMEDNKISSGDKIKSKQDGNPNLWKNEAREIAKDPLLRKYWLRRYQLFSRFDKGIRLDRESWFSVTPELLAVHMAQRCCCDVIVDAFCGAGGNSIQFAFYCERVIAVDIDPEKIAMARHNAALYHVEDRIEFIVGDFLQVAPSLQADVVFLSPPWGGPHILKSDSFDTETMLPIPGSKLFSLSRAITPNIAIYMPRNVNCAQLMMLAAGDYVNIEQDFMKKKLMAITAYYGDLSEVD